MLFSNLHTPPLETTFESAMNNAHYPVEFAAAAFIKSFGHLLSDAIYVSTALLPELQETPHTELLNKNTPSYR